PQRLQHVPVTRPTTELPQRLQYGEVRFPLPIVLDALSPRAPHRTPGSQAGQPALYHRRLAHPGFATDKDELAGALGRPLEALLQGLDFALAPHDGAIHQRWGDLPIFSDEKLIALSSDCGEIVWCVRIVAQRRPNLLHTHAQYRVRDIC